VLSEEAAASEPYRILTAVHGPWLTHNRDSNVKVSFHAFRLPIYHLDAYGCPRRADQELDAFRDLQTAGLLPEAGNARIASYVGMLSVELRCFLPSEVKREHVPFKMTKCQLAQMVPQ
jgi:hypothetical protein